MTASIKSLADAKVGDTITHEKQRAKEALPGFQEIKPMVFFRNLSCRFRNYENLRDALAKLALNDAFLDYEPETSDALGFGFRCGFLGLSTWRSSRSAWSGNTT